MAKWLDKVTKNSQWYVMGAMLIGYLSFLVLTPSASLEKTVMNWQTWVHTLFVMYLQVSAVSLAFDKGTQDGINLREFELADELNNDIIKKYNNNKEPYRKYIKDLNTHELNNIREEYLFSVGDKTYEELTRKQKKAYNNLKPIYHDIYGFNLPLFYEVTKNGKIGYKASVGKNEGKRKKQFTKGFMGIVFSAMSINMAFSVDSLGSALLSLGIIMSGLIVTFIMIYAPQLSKFKSDLPKKVMSKKTLMDSFEEYQQGKVKLNVEVKEEVIKVEEIIEEKEQEDDQLKNYESPTLEFIPN